MPPGRASLTDRRLPQPGQRVRQPPAGRQHWWRVHPPRLPGQGRVRPATEADVSLCARLYQTEPIHFVRRVEEFAEHFRQRERARRAEDWIVEVAGRPVAYLFTGIPREYRREKEAGVREVVEYAGGRVALVGALAEVMTRLELRELRLSVPWQDMDGLMSDLRPYVRARLTEGQRRGLRFEQEGPALSEAEGDQYAIVRGQERLELDGAAMTRLVMGAPAEVASNVPVAPGALGEVVPALFPLPSFLPGLNYR